MHPPRPSTPPAVRRQRGAALLIALLTVTLVATFAATALWQQWRTTEVEAAERTRLQAAWVLVGGLDWSRLILREDALAGRVDHLAEPWAVPLAEARLTSFLAADRNIASDALEGLPDAFLSGRIEDAQGRLNARNLVEGSGPAALAPFQKLFELLGLPPEQVALLAAGLRKAVPPADAAGSDGADRPLMPQRVQDLGWLGLPAATVHAIAPYVTLLPVPTTLNLNTASPEALYASVPDLDLASARRVVAQRERAFFPSVDDANRLLSEGNARFSAATHGVSTQYFEVTGRLRLDRLWVQEQSLLRRQDANLTVVWRLRGAGAMP